MSIILKLNLFRACIYLYFPELLKITILVSGYWVCYKPSLIDSVQFLHINNGSVELDASIMGVQQEGKKAKVPLNSR